MPRHFRKCLGFPQLPRPVFFNLLRFTAPLSAKKIWRHPNMTINDYLLYSSKKNLQKDWKSNILWHPYTSHFLTALLCAAAPGHWPRHFRKCLISANASDIYIYIYEVTWPQIWPKCILKKIFLNYNKKDYRFVSNSTFFTRDITDNYIQK